ncbi:MAG TPA: hypothetical protein VIK54_13820 [Acidimicrobiia bacterium]
MPDKQQAVNAQKLATALNQGVLQDAVAVGLEEQGPFTVDGLTVLDALISVGLRLVGATERDDEPSKD